MERKCKICGAAFVPDKHNVNQQRYCSKECASVAKRERRFAMGDTASVSNEQLMRARRKPKNTSATRWRMELARRADPIRFALAGVAIF